MFFFKIACFSLYRYICKSLAIFPSARQTLKSSLGTIAVATNGCLNASNALNLTFMQSIGLPAMQQCNATFLAINFSLPTRANTIRIHFQPPRKLKNSTVKKDKRQGKLWQLFYGDYGTNAKRPKLIFGQLDNGPVEFSLTPLTPPIPPWKTPFPNVDFSVSGDTWLFGAN